MTRFPRNWVECTKDGHFSSLGAVCIALTAMSPQTVLDLTPDCYSRRWACSTENLTPLLQEGADVEFIHKKRIWHLMQMCVLSHYAIRTNAGTLGDT